MASRKRKKADSEGISNEALCAEYSAVYRYALSLTRSEHEAEDITQETFLRALDAKESFSGGSSLYMLYTHPILNKEVFEQGLEDQIFIVPVQDGDRTFSINGTVLMNIEPPETGSDLPDYVRAFHFHQWSGNYADFRIGGEDPEGKLPRSLILDLGEDGIVEWDADGKVLTNTAGDISRYLPER